MRVLVTRPREDAEGFAAALNARGVATMIEPLMAIRRRNAPDLGLDGVRAVLATSANGVRALAAATARRDVPLMAVGDATARAAAAAGFTAVDVAGGDVAALARLVRRDLRPEDGPLLHIAGSDVAGDLAGDLAAAGFTCRRAVLYEATPVEALSAAARAALRGHGLDGVTLFSPRTARLFRTLVEAAGLTADCRDLTAFCLSPAVAAAAGGAWRRSIVAGRPSQDDLIDAVVAAGPAARNPHLVSPEGRRS